MVKKEEKQAVQTQPPAVEKDKSRRVFLFGRLETEVALPVIKRLLRLSDQHPDKPIDLYINSSGGNGYNADAIIAVISTIKPQVNTICLGHALSGACEILAAGTGKRSAYEFSTIMFHQTLWEAEGDITNLEIQAKQGQKFREAQIAMLARCTGKDAQIVRKDIERDFYLSAYEALDYGLIDEVLVQRSSASHKAHHGHGSAKAVVASTAAEKKTKENKAGKNSKRNQK